MCSSCQLLFDCRVCYLDSNFVVVLVDFFNTNSLNPHDAAAKIIWISACFLLQNNQFIDMVYREMLNAHYS